MKTTKELADELDAKDRLKKRGYTKERCEWCNGTGVVKGIKCLSCHGKGFYWRGPMMS